MRLHPPVTKQEALDWLRRQAELQQGDAPPAGLDQALEGMAEAMAVISATEVPEDVEPLFP